MTLAVLNCVGAGRRGSPPLLDDEMLDLLLLAQTGYAIHKLLDNGLTSASHGLLILPSGDKRHPFRVLTDPAYRRAKQTRQPPRRFGERVERVPQLVSRAWPGAIPGDADDLCVLGHPILLSGALNFVCFLIKGTRKRAGRGCTCRITRRQ